jgi:hypothetical protein
VRWLVFEWKTWTVMRGTVTPAVQHDSEELKTEGSEKSVPIPSELALELSAYVARYGGSSVVTNGEGGACPSWLLERALCARPSAP